MTCLAGAPALEISWGWLVGALIFFGLTTGLAWLVAAKVTGAGQGKQIENLTGNVDRLTTTVDTLATTVASHDSGMEKLRTERSDCEVRANKEFVTRAELVQLVKDNSDGRRHLFKKMDDLHGRVTKLLEQVSRIEARTEPGKGAG